ncbi:trypsin-like cysteine/serine peptidase domain-containing protein [Penicillium antarcticum]|uniref:trypsin-like cysteine/serine peptidase domain-containing protein n=1 Tax=Penicillium antarcticum TaxID=416450 RepID=UPI00239F8565|nr:trypsin-like cysteine/serine peptidase domain-containing protein [Penicillium antarcticum]KAJ5302375.1 trypsin-like cysteine/serine peptidase domain-containing protein [Penicillium antarcticum]
MRITNAFALTGLALSTSVNAIVNGTEATALDYPSIAGLYSSSWFGDSLICSGVVVGEYTVLTTAHCVDGSSASNLKVRVGTADRTTGGALIPISKVTSHPFYSSSTMDYDYAVLHMAQSALEVSGVAAALLPSTDDATGDDYPLRIAGWGMEASSSKTLPTSLHHVNMVSVEQSKCNDLWADDNPITKNMMCFQPDVPLAPGTSVCNSDEGGPIVDETGQTVFGMVSYFAKDCSASPRPNVGSNLNDQSAKDWIKNMIK